MNFGNEDGKVDVGGGWESVFQEAVTYIAVGLRRSCSKPGLRALPVSAWVPPTVQKSFRRLRIDPRGGCACKQAFVSVC